MLHDSSPTALHLHRRGSAPRTTAADAAPQRAALVDFCQVLLNSNEFLYVD